MRLGDNAGPRKKQKTKTTSRRCRVSAAFCQPVSDKSRRRSEALLEVGERGRNIFLALSHLLQVHFLQGPKGTVRHAGVRESGYKKKSHGDGRVALHPTPPPSRPPRPPPSSAPHLFFFYLSARRN